MKRLRCVCPLCLILTLLLGVPGVRGQSKPPIPLQHIVFKDNVLPSFIEMFAGRKKRAVRVNLREAEEGYTCNLSDVYFLNEIIDHPPTRWAVWKGIVVIVESAVRADSIFQITDTAPVANLISYGEPFMEKYQSVNDLGNGLLMMDVILVHGGLEWQFRVKNGREEWSRNNRGFDSRDIPPLPPTND
ncbi:hypothetical protein [Spirosoma sp. KUDC1026]|uniref:hypothetical protein n=1 Tax=Spirosoma sp. KUDC1026 TaxID=2745947 RepID=UPI00159B9E35|nr:hypothetical protein [Spirosoma sp. KUDC1026]QKZ14900.1 hypothetical protein HU175_20630 [Spirosoma sp. KUDC1026]